MTRAWIVGDWSIVAKRRGARLLGGSAPWQRLPGFVKYTDIGTGEDFDLVRAGCTNGVKHLPPTPAQLLGVSGQASAIAPAISVADEVKKLVDLKNAGVLTEAEFQAPKQKLLGTP